MRTGGCWVCIWLVPLRWLRGCVSDALQYRVVILATGSRMEGARKDMLIKTSVRKSVLKDTSVSHAFNGLSDHPM